MEAHVKIKSHPFLGVHLLHFLVRPPSLTKSPILAPRKLSVSFHFTVRSSCAVQVTSSASDTIDVFVVLNHAGYHPPPLPNRGTHKYSREELDKLRPGVGADYLAAQVLAPLVLTLTGHPVEPVTVELILNRGINGDVYDSLNNVVNMLSRNSAVENVSPNNIPANAGVTQDDNQPFPVYGWLEVKWVRTGSR